MRQIMKLSLAVAAFSPIIVFASHIVWLGRASSNNQTIQTAKNVVMQQLVKDYIIDDTQTQNSAYRAVKIKLSTNPQHPGAWI